ncbi:MAG: S24 family peptidase, partial [Pseudomonadota bacterium]
SKFYKLKTPPADLAYREANAEIVNIPVYDLAASAGPGSFVDQHQNPSWIEPFSKKFLASLRAHSNELAILFAGGDSMEPTIKDGALLIVDMSANALNLRSDGIYVIWHDETLKVKRLQFATGYIKAKSDNPLYDDVTIKNDHHFAIQGRVIWYGQNS